MTRGGAHQERHLLAPAVQNMDSTIHWINLYQLVFLILVCWIVIYLVDSARCLNNHGWCSSLWHFHWGCTGHPHSCSVSCHSSTLPPKETFIPRFLWRGALLDEWGKERLRGRLRFLSFYLCISCPKCPRTVEGQNALSNSFAYCSMDNTKIDIFIVHEASVKDRISWEMLPSTIFLSFADTQTRKS